MLSFRAAKALFLPVVAICVISGCKQQAEETNERPQTLEERITQLNKDLICLQRMLGAKVKVDENRPDKPVVMVDLTGTDATDERLGGLRFFKSLKSLYLGNTDITDAGLRYVDDFSELQILSIWGTRITDAGLKHLGGLTRLVALDLSQLPIT